MPFVDVPRARLYCKHEGRDDAPALVLLNSIGTDMDLWDPALSSLRERFALIRIDTRGHGASMAEAGEFTMPMLADDVLAVADALGIAQFALAGVSLGGMIGMELALRHPGRLTGLGLVCTSATMDSAAWQQRIDTIRAKGMAGIADLAMGRFLSAEFAAAHPDIHATIRRQLLTMDADGYIGCGAAIRDMDLAKRIAGISCPTLVVTGSRDTSTPHEGHGDHLVATIPHAIHAPIDAAHLAPLEAPDALAAQIITFLSGSNS